ncbi:MAG: hypothetical protein MZW92_73905 [Comamonadaceae bacterium]|nr:hypothetical protein [Comamonadaceae bacterium]
MSALPARCAVQPHALLGDALKHRSTNAARFALTAVALAAACLWRRAASWALGLGRLTVQSALGEPLRAEIDVTSLDARGSRRRCSCASRRRRPTAPPASTTTRCWPARRLTLQRAARRPPRACASPATAPVSEPFVDVHPRGRAGPAAGWCASTRCCSTRRHCARRGAGAGRRAGVAPAPAAAPAAPPPRRSPRRHRAAAARRAAGGRAGRRARRAAARRRRGRRRRAARGVDAYTRAAAATRSSASPRARSRPASRSTRCWWRCSAPTRDAFIGDNMNRLKAGAVLTVPSRRRGRRDRRRPRRARSSRRRAPTSPPTASGWPAARRARRGRRAGAPGRPGTVQAAVEDRSAGRRADAATS